MIKKNQRVISLMTAGLMTLSALSFSSRAKAVELTPEQSLAQTINQLQMYDEDLVKSYAKKTYLENLKSREVKTDSGDENEKKIEAGLNPDKTVRLVVQLEGNSLSDSISQNNLISKAASNESMKNEILSKQEPLKESIKSINSDAKILNSFYVLNNAFSVEAKAKDIDSIRELKGVSRVHIANEYYLDMNTAVDITKATSVWKNQGLKGEGVVVSIIDTGIDFSHKDMKLTDVSTAKIKQSDIGTKYPVGKGKFYTDKVPYGFNFADNNQDVKDATSSMHGMHVAGIVGANASDAEVQASTGVKGTAPEVQLLAMKVFSNNPNYSSAFEDNIAAAIEDSITHGADVINMSLGSSAGYVNPLDLEQQAIKKASDSGVVCVVSAGNSEYSTYPNKYSGVNDTGIVGSPATATDSLMVASYENTNVSGYKLDYTSSKESGQTYYDFSQSEADAITTLNNPNGYAVVDSGLGTVGDFIGKKLAGKIALVKRGDISFVDKKLNAQKAGAEGVIIFNSKPGLIGGMATDPAIKIPALGISDLDGIKLLSLVNSNLKISFKGILTSNPNPNTKNMSEFTSWGPTPNLMLRPYLSAPGGMIYSTINNNQYENMSGTSMAAPHAAGLTALVLEYMSKSEAFKNVSGKDKIETAKNLLVNTAEPALDKLTGSKLPFSPRRQGAGLANVDAALKTPVVVTFSDNNEPVISLKDLKSIDAPKEFKIKLKNYGKTDVVYNVQDSYGVMTEQDKTIKTMSFDMSAKGAIVNFETSKITVPANGEVLVKASLKVTKDAPTNAFLEGFIKLTPETSGLSVLGIPYLAFNGDWSKPSIFDEPVWTGNSIWNKSILGTNVDGKTYSLGNELNANNESVINPEKIAFNPDGDGQNNVIPVLSLLRNAKNLKVDILDEKNTVIRQISDTSDLRKSFTTHLTSSVNNWKWDGKVYNSKLGTYSSVPEGNYKVRVSANVDYENAVVQTMTLPVKVDKTPVSISEMNYKEVKTGVYNIKFKATDNLSGIEGFSLMVDTPDNLYTFINSKFLRTTPDKDGYYNLTVNLDGLNHVLILNAFDNAGNVVNVPVGVNNVQITSPAPGTFYSNGDFDINFVTDKTVIDNVTGYEVYMSSNGTSYAKIADLGKFETSYRVKFLDPGKYNFAIKALTKNQSSIGTYISGTSVIIKPTKLSLVVTSPQPSDFFNSSSTILAEGTMDVKPSTLRINEKSVTTAKTTIDVLDADGVKKGTKDVYKFSTPIDKTTLVRGNNKLSVYADLKDSFNNIIDKSEYAIDYFYEDKGAELNITNKLIALGTNLYDFVDLKDKTYTVTGNAASYLEGYDLYVNGEIKQSVSVNGTIKDKDNQTRKDFTIPVILTEKTPKIEVKLVTKTGMEIKKIINVRRMDYPVQGVAFNENVRDGIEIQGSTFTVAGQYNPNVSGLSIKVNGVIVPLTASSAVFGKNLTLVPGINDISIEISATEKETITKNIKVNSIQVVKSIPTFTLESGEKQSDGAVVAIIPRNQKTFTIKGTAADTISGLTATATLFEIGGGQLGDPIVIGQTTDKGTLNISKEIPMNVESMRIVIKVSNKFDNIVVKAMTVSKTDDFIKNFGVTFLNPVYDGMIVKKNEIRFQGNIDKELSVFKINGMDVKIAADKTFNVVVPINEGVNGVVIEAALKSAPTPVTKTTINVLSDSIAPVIIVSAPEKETIIVPSSTEKYIVKGMITETNMPQLYLNDKEVKLNDKKEFSEEIDLKEGSNVIHLVSQDLAFNKTEKYVTINKVSDKVSYLSELKVNGKDLLEFQSGNYNYNYILDALETKVPVVTASAPAELGYKVEIDNTKTVFGTTVIKVTAGDNKSVVSYKINFVRAFSVTLTSPGVIERGTETKVSVNVLNNLSTDKEVTLVAALYQNNKFITWTSVKQIIKSGSNSEVSVNFSIFNELVNPEIRCFVVDSNESMRLLSQQILISSR